MSMEGQEDRPDAAVTAAGGSPGSETQSVEEGRSWFPRSRQPRRHAASSLQRHLYSTPSRPRREASPRAGALKDRHRPDERIRDDLYGRFQRALAADSRGVAVEVNNGLVMLEGTVVDRHTKYRIEDLAEVCPGVREVDNRIRVQRSE